jgi:hypothetical protein
MLCGIEAYEIPFGNDKVAASPRRLWYVLGRVGCIFVRNRNQESMDNVLSTLIFLVYLSIVGYYFIEGQKLYRSGEKASARKMIRKSYLIFITGAVLGAILMFIFYFMKSK